MPLDVFTFAFNPETKEGTFAGNIEPQLALSILQNLVVAHAVQRATNDKEADKPKAEGVDKK